MTISTRPHETLPLARPLARSSKERATFVGMAEGERPLLWSSAAIRVLPSPRAELRSPAEADNAITVTSGDEFPMNSRRPSQKKCGRSSGVKPIAPVRRAYPSRGP
jgi:hypothetical protein